MTLALCRTILLVIQKYEFLFDLIYPMKHFIMVNFITEGTISKADTNNKSIKLKEVTNE